MKKISEDLKIKLLPWLAALAMFMQMLDGSVLNTALPSIALSFRENPLQMQAAVISYLISVAVCLPIAGWISDKFGIKKTFMFAIAAFTAGSLCCALSNSLFTLSLSRILQGMGGAFLVPVGRLAVLRVYPREKYVNVLSFIVLPALIGPLIGPMVGGFLVEYASWHWIFLINVPIGILCCAATKYIMPQMPSYASGEKFDLKGFFLFDFALVLLFAGSSSAKIIPGLSNGFFMLAAAVFVIFYFIYAKGRRNALFNLDMFKIRSFSVGIAGNLVIRLVGGSLPFLAPLFFQTALGFSPSKAGMTLLPMGITAMFAKTFAARIILKLGYKKFLILNTVILSVFIFLISFINGETPYFAIIALFSFIGMLNSLQYTAINALALIDVPDKLMSGANNMLAVSLQISMSLGVALAAYLLLKTADFEFISSKQNALGAAFSLTYVVISLLSVSGAALFVLVPKNAGNAVFKEEI
ncbi:MAG: MFS transporter [Endomicrobium sp.]|jgi:EmrB/QacA subfamily drug resistance transporter|nr:MFS transporter [Endomicrobium sp.]